MEKAPADEEGSHFNSATKRMVEKWRAGIEKVSKKLSDVREAERVARDEGATATDDEEKKRALRKEEAALDEVRAACESLFRIAADAFHNGHYAVAREAAEFIPSDVARVDDNGEPDGYFKGALFKFFYGDFYMKRLYEPVGQLQTDRSNELARAGDDAPRRSAIEKKYRDEAKKILGSGAFALLLWCSDSLRTDAALALSLKEERGFWSDILPRMTHLSVSLGADDETFQTLLGATAAFAKHADSADYPLVDRAVIWSAYAASGIGPYTELRKEADSPLIGADIQKAFAILDQHPTDEEGHTMNYRIAFGYFKILSSYTPEELLDAGITAQYAEQIRKKIRAALPGKVQLLDSICRSITEESHSRNARMKQAA